MSVERHLTGWRGMKRLGAMAAVTAGLLGLSAAPAAANHSWGGYHWARASNPFSPTLKLGNNVSGAWTSYLGQASTDWSADSFTELDPLASNFGTSYTFSNPVKTEVRGGLTSGRKCRATAGRVEVCDAAYGRNGWLGLASISVSGSHITKGTVKLNDTYYSSAKYNTPFWRAAVTCQEIGHTFGLDHQDESGADFHTCMDYSSNPDQFNGHPNYHDYEELGIIYSHLDSSTTIAASNTTAGARGLRRVRDDLYVEDRGNGNKRFVFVFWQNRGVRHSAPTEE